MKHSICGCESEDFDPTASLDHVPELWTEILKHVPQEDRLRHVSLVSRRLREACQDPCLWAELCLRHNAFLTSSRWRSLLSWLAAHASGLRKIVITDDHDPCLSGNVAAAWERRVSQLVAVLASSAPHLRSLEHRYLPQIALSPASALPVQLGQLTQLTSLRLNCGPAHVTAAQVNAVVQTLPSLQHLGIVLTLSEGTLSGFPVSIATSCSQLKHLQIYGGQLGALPPELGRLTALTGLLLTQSQVTGLPESISKLSALRSFDVRGSEDVSLPPGLTACRQLTSLHMESDSSSPVLARLHSLQVLSVTSMHGQPSRDRHWTQLTALTELQLACCASPPHRRHCTVPAELSGMAGLRRLCIINAALDDLPAGQYLSSLKSLRMEGCTFGSGLPPGLIAAKELRYLDLRERCKGVDLTAADIAVLSSLPALVHLGLSDIHRVHQQDWNARVAQLHGACVAALRAPFIVTSKTT